MTRTFRSAECEGYFVIGEYVGEIRNGTTPMIGEIVGIREQDEKFQEIVVEMFGEFNPRKIVGLTTLAIMYL